MRKAFHGPNTASFIRMIRGEPFVRPKLISRHSNRGFSERASTTLRGAYLSPSGSPVQPHAKESVHRTHPKVLLDRFWKEANSSIILCAAHKPSLIAGELAFANGPTKNEREERSGSGRGRQGLQDLGMPLINCSGLDLVRGLFGLMTKYESSAIWSTSNLTTRKAARIEALVGTIRSMDPILVPQVGVPSHEVALGGF